MTQTTPATDALHAAAPAPAPPASSNAPLGLGALLDAAVRQGRARPLLYLALTSVPIALGLLIKGTDPTLGQTAVMLTNGGAVLPGALTLQLGGLPLGGTLFPSPLPLESPDRVHGVLYALGILAVVTCNGLVTAAIAAAVGATRDAGDGRDRRETVSISQVLRLVATRARPLLGGLAWQALRLLALLVVVQIVPRLGVLLLTYVVVAWSFVPQAIVLDGAGLVAASIRSRALVGRAWFKVFGLSLLSYILLNAVSSITVNALTWLLGSLIGYNAVGGTGYSVMVGATIALVTLVLQPLLALASVLLFLDLARGKPVRGGLASPA